MTDGLSLSLSLLTLPSGATFGAAVSVMLTSYNISAASLAGDVVARGSSYINSVLYGGIPATVSYHLDTSNTPNGTGTHIGSSAYSGNVPAAADDRSLATSLGDAAYYALTTIISFNVSAGQRAEANLSSQVYIDTAGP